MHQTIVHNKNGVLIWAIYSPTDMVITLNGLSSRRIQEADSFPFLIPPLFTSSLRTYLAQYLQKLLCTPGVPLMRTPSSRIQKPNKCRITRITSAQSVQAQSATRKNTLPYQEPLYFLCAYCIDSPLNGLMALHCP